MSIRRETVVPGTVTSVPTDLLETGILPKTLHKSQFLNFKEGSSNNIQSTWCKPQ